MFHFWIENRQPEVDNVLELLTSAVSASSDYSFYLH